MEKGMEAFSYVDPAQPKPLIEVCIDKIPFGEVAQELAYYDENANITKRDNPAGVADEVIEWVARS